MSGVVRAQEVQPIATQEPSKLDTDVRSFLIAGAKIRELEQRLEGYFADVEKRLAAIQLLQKVKQRVVQSAEQVELAKEPQLRELIEEAQAMGLEWSKAGWQSSQERHALVDALQVQITAKENDNQTVFMRINRIMSLRSETVNLFSKIINETHSEKLRIMSRLHQR